MFGSVDVFLLPHLHISIRTQQSSAMPEREASDPIRVQFVCLGNICRSPLAAGAFRDLVREEGLEERFEIASSGTGNWHVGEPADQRMMVTAEANGISLDSHQAQQFSADDFARYDHIFVMDKNNLHDVLFLDEEDAHNGKVRLFREFDPEPGDFQVPDPYHGGDQGFENVHAIVDRTARPILEQFIDEYGLGEGERGNGRV